ncbi:hypothetical protein T4D_4137 [Trichinella pseudospiralis]|uniref:Uncharacterized protein n=1 Tax=Trichinella pseudospiralis TaxID=6337 RepID=A0A0V1FA50_TRIPS|nr:hypothetical protein T4D_4137 [Trichinella pseudospiralis]
MKNILQLISKFPLHDKLNVSPIISTALVGFDETWKLSMPVLFPQSIFIFKLHLEPNFGTNQQTAKKGTDKRERKA